MMLTRCPDCATAFRVTPEQLKARAGKVRCGHCSAVFNALETLEDAPPAVAAAEATAPPEPAPPASALGPLPEPSPESAAPLQPPVMSPDTPSLPDGHDAPDVLLEDVGFATDATPASRWRLLAWGLAGIAALAVLALQAAYIFRSEPAISEAGLRPLLTDMCRLLECEIPLPRKAEFVSIEASDLHPDPQRKNLLVLGATLKNRATFAQEYPHLELTLTDTRDQPMVRRVFAPAEYLAQDADARSGFAANGDLAVNLWLDAGDIGASGYRLYLFYP